MRAWDGRVSVGEVVKAFEAGLLSREIANDAVYSILEYQGLVAMREQPSPLIDEQLARSTSG